MPELGLLRSSSMERVSRRHNPHGIGKFSQSGVYQCGTLTCPAARIKILLAAGVLGQLRPFGARCAIKRSEEHTSELQSLLRISYAVFCLKTKHILHPIYIFLLPCLSLLS